MHKGLSLRVVVLSLVHLCALIGILSLLGISPLLYAFLALYLVGIFLDFREYYPVRRIFLNLLGILLSIYFLSQLSLDNLLEPLSNVLLLLLGIKGLERKGIRDLYQILLLSLFAVSLSTLYNLNITFLLILITQLFLGLTSLIFINLYKVEKDVPISTVQIKYFFYASGVLFVLIAVFSVPFFVLLPRSQFPIFGNISKKEGIKTGIAETVSLGKVGEIQEDNTVAFRVYGLKEGLKDLYWRVSVFDTYIANSWTASREKEVKPCPNEERNITYTVLLEPTYSNYLPLLDYPVNVYKAEGLDGRIYPISGYVFRSSKEISRPIRYVGVSSYSLACKDDPRDYVDVPKNLPLGIKKLAEELMQGTRTDEERIEKVVEHFSKGGYTYSLKLEKYEGDPLEYFLLVKKSGNCEYYASATALLLRLMGIPSRVVGGFKGGIWNNVGKYYIVTNSMAHVWVEAFVNGEWIRIDTTPPYTPQGLRKVSRLNLISDAIISFWHSNVVGFSLQKQIGILKSINKGVKLGLKKEFLTELVKKVIYISLVFSALYLAVITFKRLRKTPENVYINLLRILEKHLGSNVDPHKPSEVLKKLKSTPFRREVEYIVYLYQKSKYSPYRIYKDEVHTAYESLERVKKLIRTWNRS